MSTGIYIASAYANKEIVKGYIERLPSSLYVTHDWTVSPEWMAEEDKGKHESELSPEVRKRLALEDLDGVHRAKAFWLLTPDAPFGCGCFVEFGFALSRGCRLTVSGPMRTIFQTMTDVTFRTHDEAFAHLLDDK